MVPKLTFNETKLLFPFQWQGELSREPIEKTLEITCSCEDETKGANFRLKTPIPFRIKEAIEMMEMMPGESKTITIEFDPTLVDGRESTHRNEKLEFIYDLNKGGGGEPLHVMLEAIIKYPNLTLTPCDLNFGCILVDTNRKKHVTLKNVSDLEVVYAWEFVEETSNSIAEVSEESNRQIRKDSPRKKLRVNEIFDILPISGVLEPGEVETVEITYHGLLKETHYCSSSVQSRRRSRLSIDSKRGLRYN